MGPSSDRLGEHLHARLRASAGELTEAWLEEVRKRLPEEPVRIFPTQTLLDHMPELVEHIVGAVFRRQPIGEDERAVNALRSLAELRRLQGYDVAEVVGELELLGQLFLRTVAEEMRAFPGDVDAWTAVDVAIRTNEAFLQISRAVAERFSEAQAASRLARADLLQTYGGTLAHELRNHLNSAALHLQLVRAAIDDGDDAAARKGLDAIERALGKLEETRSDTQAVVLSQGRDAAAETRRQSLRRVLDLVVQDLRENARREGVAVRVISEVPDVMVDAGRLQLVLVNVVANALKLAHPERDDRWIEIRTVSAGEGVWRLEVSDNGVRIPDAVQARLFQPGSGASGRAGALGDGVALALAQEAAAQMGGRIWLEQTGAEGSTFVLEIPEPPEAVEEVR